MGLIIHNGDVTYFNLPPMTLPGSKGLVRQQYTIHPYHSANPDMASVVHSDNGGWEDTDGTLAYLNSVAPALVDLMLNIISMFKENQFGGGANSSFVADKLLFDAWEKHIGGTFNYLVDNVSRTASEWYFNQEGELKKPVEPGTEIYQLEDGDFLLRHTIYTNDMEPEVYESLNQAQRLWMLPNYTMYRYNMNTGTFEYVATNNDVLNPKNIEVIIPIMSNLPDSELAKYIRGNYDPTGKWFAINSVSVAAKDYYNMNCEIYNNRLIPLMFNKNTNEFVLPELKEDPEYGTLYMMEDDPIVINVGYVQRLVIEGAVLGEPLVAIHNDLLGEDEEDTKRVKQEALSLIYNNPLVARYFTNMF